MAGKKPEPRRSALSTEHPYAPQESAERLQATPDPAPTTSTLLVPKEPPAPAKAGEKKPMSVRATLADQARIRAAFMATNSAERHGSLSDFITRATLDKVDQLEQQYNDGKPWPAIGAGDVPTGRPLI